MYSGITSGRVLNGELLYTKILEVNLFAFAYKPEMPNIKPNLPSYSDKTWQQQGRIIYWTDRQHI